MKRTLHIIYTLFAVAIAAAPCRAAEPGADSTATEHFVHQIAFDFKPGQIIHTNEFLTGNNLEMRTMNHAWSYHLKYAFSQPEGSEKARIYKDAYQGVGVAYDDFNPQLGNPLSVYLLQGARIARLSARASLNYEWNLGLAFGWNPYDYVENPENKVIGSRVTAYIGLDLYVRWILSRHLDLNIGLGATHYSNGNTQFPNLGLNTAALRVGATYYVNRHIDRLRRDTAPLPPFDRRMTYDLILYGAWHQRGYYTEEGNAFALPGKYGVAGFNFNPMYGVNHWLRVGGSLDGTYDRSANITLDNGLVGWGEEDDYASHFHLPSSAWRQMALGVSGRVEFTMPYFAINFGIGTNFLNAHDEFSGVYELLALKVNVTRRALLHIGYTLNDFHRPRHLMLGMGWRFGRL